MRIAFVTDWFADGMGYSENCLPKAFASLGHEVHVVSSELQPDFPDYDTIYASFLGSRRKSVGTTNIDGFRLHRIPSRLLNGHIYLPGLFRILSRIHPDILQGFTIASHTAWQGSLFQPWLRYRFFLEEHTHLSVFKAPRTLFQRLYHRLRGRYIAAFCETCYAIASDVLEIARDTFGFPEHKLRIQSLGVDTQIFQPADCPERMRRRLELRQELGVADGEILCVYSGRFTEAKDPAILAEAIQRVQSPGARFKALFIGNGPPDYVQRICSLPNTVQRPFVKVSELADFYRAADIGVWPRQESTSMLDAAACGLPLVISDQVRATDRIDGNGRTYRENDSGDLARVLSELSDPALRKILGGRGAEKMRQSYSWDAIARSRAADYEASLKKHYR